MTLNKLIQTNSWLSVSTIFLELYPEEEKNIPGYESVFEKLLIMNPEETDMAIVITNERDDFDGEKYVDVSGSSSHPKNEEEEFSQAIEFTPWDQWLGMDISTESLKYFSELEIVAHCLHEMTFVGFEEEEIQEELKSFEKTVEEYKKMTNKEKGKNTTALEEFLNELKENDQENEQL